MHCPRPLRPVLWDSQPGLTHGHPQTGLGAPRKTEGPSLRPCCAGRRPGPGGGSGMWPAQARRGGSRAGLHLHLPTPGSAHEGQGQGRGGHCPPFCWPHSHRRESAPALRGGEQGAVGRRGLSGPDTRWPGDLPGASESPSVVTAPAPLSDDEAGVPRPASPAETLPGEASSAWVLRRPPGGWPLPGADSAKDRLGAGHVWTLVPGRKQTRLHPERLADMPHKTSALCFHRPG